MEYMMISDCLILSYVMISDYLIQSYMMISDYLILSYVWMDYYAKQLDRNFLKWWKFMLQWYSDDFGHRHCHRCCVAISINDTTYICVGGTFNYSISTNGIYII